MRDRWWIFWGRYKDCVDRRCDKCSGYRQKLRATDASGWIQRAEKRMPPGHNVNRSEYVLNIHKVDLGVKMKIHKEVRCHHNPRRAKCRQTERIRNLRRAAGGMRGGMPGGGRNIEQIYISITGGNITAMGGDDVIRFKWQHYDKRRKC